MLRVAGGTLTVDGLAIAPRGISEPALALPRIEVKGIDVDALEGDARVAEVALRGGTVRVRREADGTLELARMAPPPSPAPKPASTAAPWTWSVGAVSLSALAVTWEDRTTPRPAVLPLTDVQVRLEGLRGAADAASPLSASLTWNGAGRLGVKGTVQPLGSKAALELDAADLDLVPLAPYLGADVVARLTGGRAGAKAKIAVDASGAAPRWSFAGDVRLDALSLAENGNEDLLRWRSLEVSGIDAASTPPRASVRTVRLVEPRVKAYVWEDGTTSLARARRSPAAPQAASARAPPAEAGAQWRTRIGAVEIVRGRAAFVDRSLSSPAVVNVTRVEAKVTNLSSDPRTRSTVDVVLEIEGASPVRVSGTLNPLHSDAFTDLAVASRGVDLSPLDPYSGKFLGYGLRKGKIDLDLRYRVENRDLSGTNVVKVNQLTLGDATGSPDATRIPVRLALALLQDSDGVILLDVAVEGRLDDPDFHLGKVIWRAVLNVLVKVATSPFRALAALAGGGDADLSLVDFAPGSPELTPAAQERLALLAKSLARRPNVGLELEGSADPAQDGPVLRSAALERSLRRAKAAAMRPPPASVEDLPLAPDERARLVLAAYDAAFPAAPAPPRKPGDPDPAPPTAQQMEERLAAAAEVPPDAYRSLAAERAQRARAALMAAGLDQARLFLAEGGERAEKEKGARVYFGVR